MRTRRYCGFIQISILSVYLLFFSGCKSDEIITCDPDIYEVNESFNLGFSLGSLEEEVGTYTARISSEDDLDFYTITATEGTHAGIPYTTPQYFRVTFELTLPSGKDYDLYIYNEAGSVVGQSNERGDLEEFVELDWEGVIGADDTMVFGIEVRSYAGDWCCNDYTLTVTMLYSESPWL
jgi:hypothetical protein